MKRRCPAESDSFARYRFPPEVILLAVRWYLRYHRQFYDELAEKAWLGPARSLTNRVIVAHGAAFTVVLIVFQLV